MREPTSVARVAYVLKGYPRMSEIFIASEIERVERSGMPLRLFVLKPRDEQEHHPVVDRIRAVPEYLPETTSLTRTPCPRWLAQNLRTFLPARGRRARRRPVGLARAAAAALAQSLRERPAAWSPPRKVYLRDFLLAAALAERLLDAPQVRHLHAHFAHGATTVTWFAAMISGRTFSFTGHAKDIYSPALNPAGLLGRKLRAAAFAVTCTEANRRHLEAIAPGARVRLLYHGLNADFSRLLNGCPPPAARNGRLRVLGVGRMVPKKGFDVLVEACAILARSVELEAAIVGGGGEHSTEVAERIRRHGLEARVRVGGVLDQPALLEEYRGASVLCLPCRVLEDGDRDGLPNVLVEAMACGLPVVTTPVSGIPELVRDGVNGLLVPPDDPDAVAAALHRLFADRALAERLGNAGRETVLARFDGEALVAPLVELFREVSA
jgi:glycosyltransferase involved in cell wall biosynthesis